MRTITFLTASAILVAPAFADQVMRSSSPTGVQIQGNADIRAQQESVAGVAAGQGNETKNTASAIRGGTQIQGNTKIQAEQKNAKAIAVGKDNKASNEAGEIGGK